MSIRHKAFLSLVCGLSAASLAVSGAHAQEAAGSDSAVVLAAPGAAPLAFDSVQVGMLARLDAVGLITRARAARVQALFGDTLLVRGVKNRELVRIPPDRIEWMQVSTGRGSTARGVTKGALMGVAAGFLLASAVQLWSDRDSNQTPEGCPFSLSSGCGRSRRLFVAGMALGALGGAGLAAEAGDHRWRLVRLPRP